MFQTIRAKVGSRRTHWFVSILFVLVVVGTALCATMMLRSAERSMRLDMAHKLDTQARNRVAALTVWQGTLLSQVSRLVEPDIFRLFAAEVNALGTDVSPLLQAARTGEGSGDLGELAANLPLMRKMLNDFIAISGLTEARLLNRSLQDVLSSVAPAKALTPEERAALREMYSSGKPVFLPIRNGENGLSLELAQPVFAPKYASDPEDKPVAAMLLTWNVTDKVQEVTLPTGEDGRGSMLVQQAGTALQEVRADGTILDLPGWTLEQDGLPLAQRELSNGVPVFAVGAAVPGSPWLAVERLDVAGVEEAAHTTRVMIWGGMGALALVLLVLLGFFWWWLVGRRERAVSAELAGLNSIVNLQSQFLSSINEAMGGGLLLTALNSIIIYANTTFGRMVSHSPESLIGLSGPSLLGEECSAELKTLFHTVSTTGQTEACTAAIEQSGKQEHYHIVCSPFRDEDSKIVGIVSVFQNITGLVEAQKYRQRMVEQTVNVLVGAIEAVDPYLRGQSSMTMRLALHIAELMHLDAKDEATIRIAANLFQVGMIQLPYRLISKQGPLTAEERDQLQTHVDYARKSLADIDFGLPVVEAICQMHECMDGSGYPRHLRGDEIGIHGRILGIANTFCALVRPRSYRQALSVEQALGILLETPHRYDVAIVEMVRQFLKTPDGRAFMSGIWAKDAQDAKDAKDAQDVQDAREASETIPV